MKAFSCWAVISALALLTDGALARPEIRPGDALAPEDLPAEAQQFEGALRGEPVDAAGNSVVERRRFDARWVRLGLGTGLGMPGALIGGYAELTPWERTTAGLEAGLTFWGPAGGAYVRLRPIIWGGEGRNLLNAFVLQASYTVMRDGELDMMPCIHSCRELEYLDRTAQFGGLSAGFEHELASGWSIRYDFGVGRALFATPWKCRRIDNGMAAPCEGDRPDDDIPIVSFAFGYTL
jgi:hypothetical protein